MPRTANRPTSLLIHLYPVGFQPVIPVFYLFFHIVKSYSFHVLIEQLIKHTVSEFSKSLKTIEGSTEYDKIVSDKYREYLRNSIGEVQSIINGYFETIIEEENASVENVLENTLELVEKRESPKYEEVRLENSRTLELYKSQLAEVKEELEKFYRIKYRLISIGLWIIGLLYRKIFFR